MGKLWSEVQKRPPPRAQVGGPLDTINDQFHDAYDQSRTEARHEAPVFVVLADELIVFHRGERSAWSFSPRTFHVIKSVTHAPLAIFAAVSRLADGALDAQARDRLGAQRERLAEALSRVDRDASELNAQTRQDLRTVLQSCARFIDALEERPQGADLTEFARALGPVLLRLADDATQLQLDALHAHASEALGVLTPDALAELKVVVAGEHQARARSLAMQYFQKRLAEPADTERRVAYAEGISDEQGALALVGTQRLDHAISLAFFGDEHRLQRDILGDAAHARLAAFDLTQT